MRAARAAERDIVAVQATTTKAVEAAVVDDTAQDEAYAAEDTQDEALLDELLEMTQPPKWH